MFQRFAFLKKPLVFDNLKIFQLDLRSLAVSRIIIGLLIIIDNALRLTNLKAHYTDAGILPLALLLKKEAPQGFTFFIHSGSSEWAIFLFILSSLFALGFLVGWKTRVMSILCWAMAVSLQYRNPFIIDGGDVLLRCFLFWFMFLPLGARWSLDSYLGGRDCKKGGGDRPKGDWDLFASFASFALPLQLFLMYYFSAVLKTSSEWWPEGTASGFALSLEAFTEPLGYWLLQFPELLKSITRFTYVLEFVFVFLLLSWGWWRFLGVCLFIFFHFSLYAAMDLALFPWIAAGCLISLIPEEFWNLFFKPKSKSNILNEVLWKQVLVLPFIYLTICWNFMGYTRNWDFPNIAKKLVRFVHIDQHWGMFAPYPLKDSGWYEFGITQWNGEYVHTFIDPKSEAEWDEEKDQPKRINEFYVDQRWRKYLLNIWEKKNSSLRRGLAGYLCDQWNRSREDETLDKALSVDFEFELSVNKEYLKRGPREGIDLGSYDCQVLQE